jgi:hypothetical protein
MACSQAKKEPVILMKSDFCDLYQNFDKFMDMEDKNAINYLDDFKEKWEKGDGKKIAKDKKLDLSKPEIRLLKVFFEYIRTNEIAFYQEKKCIK